MFLRCLMSAGMALLLGGCAEWVAETRLIPVAERDTPGLIGRYIGNETGAALIAPGDDGFVRITDLEAKDPPANVAFDVLREEPLAPALDGTQEVDREDYGPPVTGRSFLIEIPMEGDTGKTVYAYGIARVRGSAPARSFTLYTPLCSKAAEAQAARKEDQACVFDDYARLRAAALDALAWQDEARMEIGSHTFVLDGRPPRERVDAIEADVESNEP